MKTKFLYGCKVKVINGFYKGLKGTVVDYCKTDGIFENDKYYVVSNGIRQWLDENLLEKDYNE